MYDRIYGVDFSGGVEAGRKIWIAGGVVEGGTLRLETCEQASNLFGCGKYRDTALDGLRMFIRQQSPCVVGLDFPFGIPQLLVEDASWGTFVANFARRFPNAEQFKITCTEIAQRKTSRKELKRVTDSESDTPMSPYNLRIYRQTYYGIRDVLVPLIQSGDVSVLPMQPAILGRAWLLEICPASTLKHLGLEYQFYKGRGFAAARMNLVDALEQRSRVRVPGGIRDKIENDHDGDALDSVIAALATLRALCDPIGLKTGEPPYSLEGRVYVW